MKKKSIIIIVTGVIAAVLVCLAVIFILNSRKTENIKVGMTKEKVMSILNRGKYRRKYEKSEIDDGAKISIRINETSLENIKWKVIIRIDTASNIVNYIAFVSDNNYTGESDRIEILHNFLVESYGNFSYESEYKNGKYENWITEEMEIIYAAYGNPIIVWNLVSEDSTGLSEGEN